jgi:hypothetical protein
VPEQPAGGGEEVPLSVESIHEMLYQVARSPPPLPTSQHAKETPHKTDMHCTERQPEGWCGRGGGQIEDQGETDEEMAASIEDGGEYAPHAVMRPQGLLRILFELWAGGGGGATAVGGSALKSHTTAGQRDGGGRRHWGHPFGRSPAHTVAQAYPCIRAARACH